MFIVWLQKSNKRLQLEFFTDEIKSLSKLDYYQIPGTPQQCTFTIPHTGIELKTFSLESETLTSRLLNWHPTVLISNYNQSMIAC